ncbi:UbiD family decarboxylase domain-containing protein [Roseinatronobacter thiooxidans]
MLQAALRARPRICRSAPVQEARDIADLTQIPAQTPWPLDAGPLITWPVVITRPHGTQADQIARYNLGVYRAQVLGPDRLILRWLAHRGGAAIASGLDDTLLTRAAGVQLKERRPLVLLAREAPLTLAHLRNMTAVTEMGGIILPPVPAFYLKPDNVQAITAQIAARAVDLLRLGAAQANAWQG